MKRIILFFAFVFPIAIFIFLRYFGKNEFTIPVYYEEGVSTFPQGCSGISETTPFKVSEATLNSLGWKGKAVLIINDTAREIRKNLSKLMEDFEKDKLESIVLPPDTSSPTKYRCEFLLELPWTAVLLDDQRRIRGYYTPDTREELDRLSVELKILLNKY